MDLIFESSFLNAVSLFEGALDSLFTEFVCGKPSHRVGHYSRVKVRSRRDFRVILLQGKKYPTILPYTGFLETTKMYLNDGKPFIDVDPPDWLILADAILIRNAIAHRSSYAMEKFKKKVAGVSGMPLHRRIPGPLLRKVYKSFPDEQYLGLYFDTFEKVVGTLAAGW